MNSKIQEAYNRLSQARNGVNVAATELLNCHPVAHATRYPTLVKSVDFFVDTYRSTFLCFLELVIQAGLAVLAFAAAEVCNFKIFQ